MPPASTVRPISGLSILAGLVEVDELDHVGRLDAAERAVAVGRHHHLVVRVQQELGRLDDRAAVFPPRAQLVGDVPRHSEADREADLVRDLFGLVERIHAGRDHGHAHALKRLSFLLEADQLPAAERSPVAPVEQDRPCTSRRARPAGSGFPRRPDRVAGRGTNPRYRAFRPSVLASSSTLPAGFAGNAPPVAMPPKRALRNAAARIPPHAFFHRHARTCSAGITSGRAAVARRKTWPGNKFRACTARAVPDASTSSGPSG